MRPIADLIETLRRAQVRIWSDGGNLHFRAPRGALTDALRAEMKQRKPELLEFLREAETSVSLPSIRRIERTDHPPVSLAQQRLWVLQQIEGPSPTYNIPSAVHLIGGLNVSAMENSLQAIVQRHESLRTTFLDRGGEVVQVISPRAAIGLPVTDLRSLSRAERHEEARRQIREESLRPFDLQDGPLVRFQLWLLSDDEHVLFVNVHHIVFDGMSIPVFLKELSELYQSFVSQTASQLPEPAVQFADYAQCQREWMKDDALQRQLDYWKQQLEGLPPLLELPTDFARPRVQTSSGRIHQSLVESETTGQLRRFAQESGTTLYTVLLSALSVLVARYTGREDIPVGCPVTNRNRPELDGLIGFFVNTLVLRTDLSDNPTFREFVERTRGTVLDGFASQELPFEHLVEALSPERNTSYTPLVQLTLMLLEGYENILQLPELEVRPFPFDNPISRFDLSLEVYESPQGLDVYWIYNRDLFESSTIERMSCNFERLLSGLSDSLDQPVSEISFLDDGERRQILQGWNDTRVSYPPSATIPQLFADQSARTPDAVAVAFEDQTLTYAELEDRVNRLATRLVADGVGEDTLVGICAERSPELVIGLLAIMKSGGAYVPLEPTDPSDRLAFMIEDSQVSVILTLDRLADRLPGGAAQVIVLDAPQPEWEGVDVPLPAVLRPQSLAYMIYTSGSTGKPKGAGNSHAGIVNRLLWMQDTFRLDAADTVLQKTPFTFDVSVWEFFWPLITGARLVLAQPGGHRDPVYLQELIDREQVTTLHFVPSMLEAFLNTDDLSDCPSLKRVLCSGEALPADLAQRFGRCFAAELHNLYGPTEAAIDVTHWACPAGFSGARVPIGRPVANTRIYILDGCMQPVPIGASGELYIGGVQLARGYHLRPGLTAERFVPDPFAADAGARLYRTGDLARFRQDGSVEFLGRMDHQVKLRGFRIEPGEIEALLSSHADIRQCVVAVLNPATATERLVAWIVLVDSVQPPDTGALRTYLAADVPEYMVPSAFVVLEEFPLTSSGKVDRRALPDPTFSASADAYVAPRNATEEILQGTWSEILEVPRIGVHDNYFRLGGHSLLATQVIGRVRRAFGIELPLRSLFEAPTIAGLADRIVQIRRRADGDAGHGIRSATDAGDDLPLSFAQARLWYLKQLEELSSNYNMPFAMRLSGPVSAEALRLSLQAVTERQESLRTRFVNRDGEPAQVIDAPGEFDLPVTDLSHLPEDEQTLRVHEMCQQEISREFDFSAGPLLVTRLVRLGETEHVLLINMHHIISDGWSLGILVDELAAFYRGITEEANVQLPELPIQYRDFAHWQRRWLTGDVLDRQLQFWIDRIADAPRLHNLPTDRPRPAEQSYRGAVERFEVSAELTEQLRQLSRQSDTTMFMTLYATFVALLSRHTDDDDLVVATAIANRNRAEIERLIGFFVNTLVLRTDVSGDPAFSEFLGRVREVALDAYAHQDLPFEQLVEEIQPERNLSHHPLFQIMFVLQNAPLHELELPGLDLSPLHLDGTSAKFDICFIMSHSGNGLSGYIEYSTDLFDASTIARLARHFCVLLQQVVREPQTRISELRLLEEEERRRVVEEFSPAATVSTDTRPVHRVFEQQAAETPNAVALSFKGTEWTFEQLNHDANRLAHHLRTLGVGAECLVAIAMHRSRDMVVAVLGVMKAGGAWVPMDPESPDERLTFVLDDAEISIILTQQTFEPRFAAFRGTVICPDQEAEEWDNQPTSNPDVNPEPGSLAYVIYTSGSTGLPKGCRMEHGNLSNYLSWAQNHYLNDGNAGEFGLFTSLCFDLTITSLFLPLLRGRCLHVFGESEELSDVLRTMMDPDCSVDSIKLTPSHISLLGHLKPAATNVELAIVGGEALTLDQVRILRELNPSMRIYNEYGPTEATVGCIVHQVEPGEQRILIGRPIANTQVCLLAGNEPVPIGIPGEICVAGSGLSRGYLNRPDLTAERFVPFPLCDGERMYRTGDLGRWLEDGSIEYLGRNDDQVKIRGFRVEPAEIESVLNEHPTVRECSVILREDTPGDARLAAYVVAAEGQRAGISELRGFLSQRLPDYMIPAHFLELPSLPLTAHGKVDRRALPAPDASRPELEESLVTPRNELEQALAEIYQDVLGLDEVGVDDDFFELGGHSLLATQVVSRVCSVFDVEISLTDFFRANTIALCVQHIESQRGDDTTAAADSVISEVQRDGPLPLSFAQERLWFLDQLEPGNPFYNVAIALDIVGPLNVDVLHESLQQIVRRHEVLRTSFPAVDGDPVQHVAADLTLALPLTDLSGLTETMRLPEVHRLIEEEARKPFNLMRGPLIRTELLRVDAEKHVLLFTMHHIVSDGWSLGVIIDELAEFYDAGCRDRNHSLTTLPVQYADFAAWQRKWLSGDVLQQQLDYWKRKLADTPPVLELPLDHPRPPMQSYRGSSVRFRVSPEVTTRLKALSRQTESTLFVTLISAFATLLQRYSGQDDIVIGSPIANRNREQIESLIGFFVNTLAIRMDLAGNPTFEELAVQTRDTALEAFDHQDLPFERLVDELQPERDLSLNPLFQVMFSLNNVPARPLELQDLKVAPVESKRVAALFDLVLDVWETDDFLTCVLEYNTDLFEESTVERITQNLQTLLTAIAEDAGQRLAELPVLTEFEQQSLLRTGAGRRVRYPVDQTIPALFEQQVEAGPERIAAVHNGKQLSYAEVNARANRIAHRLKYMGIQRNDFVAILDHRGLDSLAAMLGILKAGAAFVPVDPAYPEDRIHYMLDDSDVRIVLTRGELQDHVHTVAGDNPPAVLDLDDVGADGEPDGNLPPLSQSHDRAYMLYTSGTTGRPKGAIVRHDGAVNHIFAEFELLGFHRDSRFLQSAPSSSDISVWQLLGPVLIGGRTVVADFETVCDASLLFHLIRREQITLIELVPAVMRELLEFVRHRSPEDRELRHLEWSMITGEAAPVSVVNDWLETWPDIPLVNAYGPTEAADDICQHVIESAIPEERRSVPIGRPLPNLTLYVLDSSLRLVPRGVPGEICVSGIGVGEGYWQQEEKTAESFVCNPYASPERGDVLYRTGDLGRWLPDGTLECLDRIDNQVNVRGFRIELAEVESVLRQHRAVRESTVIVARDNAGDSRLVGFVVPADSDDTTNEDGDALSEQQIQLWQDLHEDSYRDSLTEGDPTFNHIGWDSNYTNTPLHVSHMREYVDFTVQRILDLKPRRVLEIGCGTGLIMFPLLPELKEYTGTDLSRVAIEQLQDLQGSPDLQQRIPGLESAELFVRKADDLTWCSAEQFDTVLLPSVIQYFPGIEYLVQVIDGLISNALTPEGTIFIGDVRSLWLLETFHASVQLHKAPDEVSRADVSERVREQLLQEQELAIAPEFFAALPDLFPQISTVEILPKRGTHQNEMTQFRYDVRIRLGERTAALREPDWVDWRDDRRSADELCRSLEADEPSVLAISHIENRRLFQHRRAMACLHETDGCDSIGELRAQLAAEPSAGIEPEDLYAIADRLPYSVHLCFARSGVDGCFDAVFVRDGSERPGSARGSADITNAQSRSRFANNPLHEKLQRRLIPRLRDFLKERIPNYMVPADIVLLNELPRTPAGKIDRRALPIPEATDRATDDDYVAPRNSHEEQLASIWAEVLGIQRVGIHSNFFDLGGHSLKATQVVSRIRRDMGIGIPLREIFSHPTIAELTEVVAAGESSSRTEIAVVPDADSYPLSYAQQRIWMVSQLEGGSAAYSMPEAVLLDGHIDAGLVEEALLQVIHRHESLRTTFVVVDGEPRQRVSQGTDFRLDVQDLTGEPDAEQRARDLADENARTEFDLEVGPLIRASLLKLDSARHVLLFNMHHIVSDDWSVGVIVREFVSHLESLQNGTSGELPVLRIQYRDYAASQVRRMQNGELDDAREYWHEKLSGNIPVLEFPADHPRPPIPSFRGSTHSFELDRDLTQRVNALCRDQNASLFMVLVASIKTLLYRYTGQEDIVVGCPIAERNHVDLEHSVGLFLNTLALRDRVAGRRSFESLLSSVRETTTEAYEHQEYPFDRLVSELQLQRNSERSPLFDVMVILQNVEPYELTIDGARVRPFDQQIQTVQFDLCFYCSEVDGRLRIDLRYNSDIFEPVTAQNLSQRLKQLIDCVVEQPLSLLDDLPLELPVKSASDPVEVAARGSAVPPSAPLSWHQERIWFIDRFETGNVYETSPIYHNIPWLIRLRGPVNSDAIEWSLARLMERHSVLRTQIKAHGDELEQVVSDVEGRLHPEVLHDARNADDAIRLALESASRPFALEQELPTRFVLLPFAEDEALFAITVHHLVADRQSLRILGREFLQLYESRCSGSDDPLAASAPAYANWALWQRNLTHDARERLLFHWRWVLRGGLQALELPEDRPRPAVHTYTAARHQFELPHDAVTAAGTDESAVLLTAYFILLHRYSSQDEIIVGTSVPLRTVELSDMVGPVDNLVPLREFPRGNLSCDTFMKQVRRTVAAAHSNAALPFDLLVQKLAPEKDMSRTALFDVVFQYEEDSAAESAPGDLNASVIPANLGLGKYDLNLLVRRHESGLSAEIVYNADLFDFSTIDRMAGHYSTLLASMASQPGCGINDLAMLRDDELQQQLVTWNPVGTQYPESATIVELFEHQANVHSTRTAVDDRDQRLSYEELNGRANQLAHFLRDRGVKRDTLVAVCMDRSSDLIVALLGILKAGGAYLPLDPALPVSRKQFILDDARVEFCVTSTALVDSLPVGIASQVVMDEPGVLDDWPRSNPERVNTCDDLAYCIYTSGSTGRPKGALVEHRSVVRLMINDDLQFEFSEEDVWTLFHSYAFDFSVWEMYGALLYGGRLVIVPSELTKDPALFLDLIRRKGVTVLNQTPSAFHLLAQEACAAEPEEHSLRYVIFGGEALSPATLRDWMECYPETHMVNMYGITETTVHVTFKQLTWDDVDANSKGIGVPIPTTTAYIMDSDLRLLPVGVTGEICVGGPGVCRGYLHRDELTQRKFVENPYRPGERLYRSGDRGRLLPNGELCYLGRIDDQVQVRGFRIEPGEIEAALLRHPTVREAVVIPQEHDTSIRLIAWLTAQPDEVIPDADELRSFLTKFLPDHMVPAVFATIDRLPLTVNGKVDRRALPDPDDAQVRSEAEFIEPGDGPEQDVARIWQDVLNLERVGARDNFFDLGGDSLLLIRVRNRLREAFGFEIPVVELFRHPTVDTLSRFLADRSSSVAEVQQPSSRAARRRAAMRRQHSGNREGGST